MSGRRSTIPGQEGLWKRQPMGQWQCLIGWGSIYDYSYCNRILVYFCEHWRSGTDAYEDFWKISQFEFLIRFGGDKAIDNFKSSCWGHLAAFLATAKTVIPQQGAQNRPSVWNWEEFIHHLDGINISNYRWQKCLAASLGWPGHRRPEGRFPAWAASMFII